jgi:ankyrin repeat protein
MTALHYAAKNGHAEVVEQLLAKGATQEANKVRPRPQTD